MEPMARPEQLSDDAVSAALGNLPGWERDGSEIVRTFECASFPDAIAFVVRVGYLAEAANHHPDLDIRWRKVHVALSTHDAGGLTALDVELADKISTAFAGMNAG
jgi:4a-hydroxytetrahydrobiopterin dehydratase